MIEKNTDEQLSVRRAMSAVSFSGMVVGRMGWAMIFFGLITWGPSYLSKARHFDLHHMGLATFFIFIAAWIGENVGGYAVDWLQLRLPRDAAFKIILGISGVGALSGLLILPFVESPILAVVVLSASLFFLFIGGIYWVIPGMLAPLEKISFVGSIMNFAGTSGGIIAPIVVGLIVQITGGFRNAIFYFAFCAFAYLVGSLLIDFRRVK